MSYEEVKHLTQCSTTGVVCPR